MTIVNLEPLLRGLGDLSPVPVGEIKTTYWAGGGPYTQVVDDHVIFSPERAILIHSGNFVKEVVLEPTNGFNCVRWQVRDYKSGASYETFTLIPDVDTVDFADLVVVDPQTFEPPDDVSNAWEATVEQLEELSDNTRAAADEAATAQLNAVNAAIQAGEHRQYAQVSAQNAHVSRTEAEAARDIAVGSAAGLVWVSANDMHSSTGNPIKGFVGSGLGKVPVWLCNDSSVTQLNCVVGVPSDWVNVDITLIWATTIVTSLGEVRLEVKNDRMVIGGHVELAGPAAALRAPAPALPSNLQSTLLISNTPVSSGLMNLKVLRRADATDTKAGDIGIIGVKISKTVLP